jgi:peptide/nickel transport system permease protein
MGLIFITHNLAVVAEVADRVCVMYAGEIVEEGPVAEVFAEPRHPYTAALMASAPEGDGAQLSAIPGSVPPPQALPAGCTFAPRCTRAVDNCHSTKPAFVETGPGRASRCLRWREVA